jgi:hypothetical protein
MPDFRQKHKKTEAMWSITSVKFFILLFLRWHYPHQVLWVEALLQLPLSRSFQLPCSVFYSITRLIGIVNILTNAGWCQEVVGVFVDRSPSFFCELYAAYAWNASRLPSRMLTLPTPPALSGPSIVWQRGAQKSMHRLRYRLTLNQLSRSLATPQLLISIWVPEAPSMTKGSPSKILQSCNSSFAC